MIQGRKVIIEGGEEGILLQFISLRIGLNSKDEVSGIIELGDGRIKVTPRFKFKEPNELFQEQPKQIRIIPKTNPEDRQKLNEGYDGEDSHY